MAIYDLLKSGMERGKINRSIQPESNMHIVGRTRLQLVEEPQPSLRERSAVAYYPVLGRRMPVFRRIRLNTQYHGASKQGSYAPEWRCVKLCLLPAPQQYRKYGRYSEAIVTIHLAPLRRNLKLRMPFSWVPR